MIKISNCGGKKTGKCFAALSSISSSFCKAGFLGYSIAFNIAKVRGVPGSVLVLQLNYSCANNQQDIHTTERDRSAYTSRPSSLDYAGELI